MEKSKVAILLTLSGAAAVAGGMRTVAGAVSGVGGAFRDAVATASHLLQIGNQIVGMSSRIAQAGVRAGAALVNPNIDFEQYRVQFTQLLGSVDAADARIRELYAYANNTPFLNPDVVRAGKILEQAGGAALGTGKALQMVGDMAAYAGEGRSMSDLATWVGRLYSNLQGGQPIGEAAQRLQEMAVLTGVERNELVALAQSGASATQMWAAFEKAMAKTSGTAAKLGETFYGARSTVQGLWGEIKRLSGERLFEVLKEDIIGLRDDMSETFATGRIQAFADAAGERIAELYRRIKELTIGDLGFADLLSVAETGEFASAIGAGLSTVARNFWEQFVYFAKLYAPDMQAALIPRRLHGIMGVDEEEPMAERRERIRAPRVGNVGTAFRAAAAGYDADYAANVARAPIVSMEQLMGGGSTSALQQNTRRAAEASELTARRGESLAEAMARVQAASEKTAANLERAASAGARL